MKNVFLIIVVLVNLFSVLDSKDLALDYNRLNPLEIERLKLNTCIQKVDSKNITLNELKQCLSSALQSEFDNEISPKDSKLESFLFKLQENYKDYSKECYPNKNIVRIYSFNKKFGLRNALISYCANESECADSEMMELLLQDETLYLEDIENIDRTTSVDDRGCFGSVVLKIDSNAIGKIYRFSGCGMDGQDNSILVFKSFVDNDRIYILSIHEYKGTFHFCHR